MLFRVFLKKIWIICLRPFLSIYKYIFWILVYILEFNEHYSFLIFFTIPSTLKISNFQTSSWCQQDLNQTPTMLILIKSVSKIILHYFWAVIEVYQWRSWYSKQTKLTTTPRKHSRNLIVFFFSYLSENTLKIYYKVPIVDGEKKIFSIVR